MKRRRALLALAAALAAPLARGQAERIRVIGYLTLAGKPTLRDEVFQKRLRELGWTDGKNLRLEIRRAGNDTARLDAMADELVRMKVDLIVATATPAVAAAHKATKSIPIVSMSADPVTNRFVASLARPGGNVTGISMMMPQLAGKRLELLKEIFPRLSRVAFLLYAKDQSHKIFAKEAEEAARRLGLEFRPVIVQGVAEIEAAFASMQKDRMDAVIVQPLFVNTLGQGPRIVQLAIGHRLPTIGDSDVFADIGGLVMYGPDPLPMYQRVADFADRVLRGAKPADMPIEQPSRFELAVNLRTASALGVAIPKSVIARADRVIE